MRSGTGNGAPSFGGSSGRNSLVIQQNTKTVVPETGFIEKKVVTVNKFGNDADFAIEEEQNWFVIPED